MRDQAGTSPTNLTQLSSVQEQKLPGKWRCWGAADFLSSVVGVKHVQILIIARVETARGNEKAGPCGLCRICCIGCSVHVRVCRKCGCAREEREVCGLCDSCCPGCINTNFSVGGSLSGQSAKGVHGPACQNCRKKGDTGSCGFCTKCCWGEDVCEDLSHCKARNCQGKRRMLKAGPCGLCASCCIGCSVHAWIRDGGLG